MNISVVLVAYYGDQWLPGCLESLVEASARPLHLVLIDNAGNTLIEDLDLAGFDAEMLSTPHPMGFAKANNFALTTASHLNDTVLFLNQDTISPRGWIDECHSSLEANAALGAVSPLVRTYEDDGWDPSFLACLTDKQGDALQPRGVSRDLLTTRHVPAPALMVRTNVLEKVGPFDPVFGSYYEDYDLCRRIRNQDYVVGFCTTARIRHFSGGSTTTREQERHRMRQVIRNRVLYRLREDGNPRWRSALGWAMQDFPRRLGRGLAGTPSSQPPGVTLRAYGDLLRLGRRLVSQSYDEAMWQRYLDDIGWPPTRASETEQEVEVA